MHSGLVDQEPSEVWTGCSSSRLRLETSLVLRCLIPLDPSLTTTIQACTQQLVCSGRARSLAIMRRTRSTLHSARWEACTQTSITPWYEGLVLCSAKSRMVATTAPSDSEWYTRFMAGYHARVGEQRKQDAAISLPQILAVQERLEEAWQEASARGELGEMHSVAEMGAFFLAGYCGSFCGFELPKILLTELKDQICCEDWRHEVAHVGTPLRGHFKARWNAKVKLLIIVAAVTALGLKPVLWLSRLVDVLSDLEITSGWLFQNDKGYPQPLSFFEEDFYATLIAIRDCDPSLLSQIWISWRTISWRALYDVAWLPELQRPASPSWISIGWITGKLRGRRSSLPLCKSSTLSKSSCSVPTCDSPWHYKESRIYWTYLSLWASITQWVVVGFVYPSVLGSATCYLSIREVAWSVRHVDLVSIPWLMRRASDTDSRRPAWCLHC